jgi:hypothetical protein
VRIGPFDEEEFASLGERIPTEAKSMRARGCL